jgi:hypothetical protein
LRAHFHASVERWRHDHKYLEPFMKQLQRHLSKRLGTPKPNASLSPFLPLISPL